jgi:putative alpha-1,2-mannosidase
MLHNLLFTFLLLLHEFRFGIVGGIKNPEEYPNLLAGSFTDGNRLSTGNTLPLVGRPWGFNHWAPQTRDMNRGSWWFSGSDTSLTWIRCTHQPSPWIGDWGNFEFAPQIGEISRSPQLIWQPRGAFIKPYLFDATFAPVNLRIELTPTDHGAIVRITFPATTEWGNKHVCFASVGWRDRGSANGGGNFIYGVTTAVHTDRLLVSNFNLHMRAESPESVEAYPVADMMCFKYKKDATVVHIRMATSLISLSQVQTNFNRELPKSKSFDQILLETKMVWNK